jgi:hypothetical protein
VLFGAERYGPLTALLKRSGEARVSVVRAVIATLSAEEAGADQNRLEALLFIM